MIELIKKYGFLVLLVLMLAFEFAVLAAVLVGG